MLTNTQSISYFFLGPAPVGLGRGAGGITTLDGTLIPTSSTIRGLIAGTSPSKGILASLRQTSKVSWSLEAKSGDSTRTMARPSEPSHLRETA